VATRAVLAGATLLTPGWVSLEWALLAGCPWSGHSWLGVLGVGTPGWVSLEWALLALG